MKGGEAVLISYFDSERAHLSGRLVIAFLPLPPFASFFSPSAFLVLSLFDSVWFGNCQSILQSMMDVRISHPESHPSASSPFPSLPYVRALSASRREGRKGRAGEGAQVTVTTRDRRRPASPSTLLARDGMYNYSII